MSLRFKLCASHSGLAQVGRYDVMTGLGKSNCLGSYPTGAVQ